MLTDKVEDALQKVSRAMLGGDKNLHILTIRAALEAQSVADSKRVAVPDEVVAAISDLKKTFPREEYFGTGGLVRILIKWLDEQEARDE